MRWEQPIIRRIQQGESAALAVLYDKLAGPVYQTAIIVTGSVAVAEDITRHVFLTVWRNPDSMLGHQEHLGDHLTWRAYEQGALWRARHPTDRPTLTDPPLPQGDGAAA